MSSIAFDTHKAVTNIRQAGADERLAEAIVSELQRTADLPDISTLATKIDIAVLNGRIDALEAKLTGKIDAQDGKLNLILWMISVLGLASLVLPHLHLPFLK